jgi:preprotein translocase subunit YajC
MEQEVIKMAASQGLWALLFVVLLFWVLRENAKREEKYQNILQDLNQQASCIRRYSAQSM